MNTKVYKSFEDYYGVNYRHSRTEKAGVFDKHIHTMYEVLYVKEVEEGKMNVEGSLYPLFPNAMLIIPPGNYHFVMPKQDKPYERFVFNFSEKLLVDLGLDRFNKPLLINSMEYPIVAATFSRLKQYADMLGEESFAFVAKNALCELLIYVKHAPLKVEEALLHANEIVIRAITYINENLASIGSAEDIAKALYVSQSTLCHSFKTEMKISLMKYVRNKKIMLAAALIENGEKPSQASAKAGFDDYSTFFRAYKSTFSRSPASK
jgi:AraC-like DNA-binding protein